MNSGEKGKMRRAKSIDELYEEVRDHDLVITNDAALATALNGRIDRPVVGYFAVTPRQLAAHLAAETRGRCLEPELSILRSISEETGLDFRYVHGEVENIREIRRYTADVPKHLHTRNSRRVYESLIAHETLERVMADFVPENSQFFRDHPRVAVIGPELFDDLDKHFNPPDADIVELFADEYYVPEVAYELGNDRQIAENAVDLIDRDRAQDYAVIINSSSPIADAVRSALYRRHIPFVNALNVRDLAQIRDYIKFVSLALQYETLRVKHVKEIFSNYNGTFRAGREEFLLSKQGEEDMLKQASRLRGIMESIRGMTFGQVKDEICSRSSKIQVGLILDELDLTDSLITPSLVAEMTYAVDSVSDLRHSEQVPENEKNGVLIADCSRSAYVDRPVVLYLGMEQDWNVTVVGKQYLDVEEETEKNALRLTVLMQQGSSRVYCVNTTKNGKPARPCMAFDMILGRPVTTFRDLFAKVVPGRWHRPEQARTPERAEDGDLPAYERGFSKSSFNAYFCCPRRYLFETVLRTSEQKSSEFGNLIHEFAELYACYPDTVTEMGVDAFVNMISDRYSGLSTPLMEDLDSDRIRCAMVNVMRYLDSRGMLRMPLDIPLEKKKEYKRNRFMIALGLDMTSTACETDFSSTDSPIHGEFDLFRNGTVVDYKTGKALSGREIRSKMVMDPVDSYPEFQPMIYLAIAADHSGNGRFEMLYAMDHDVESADPSFDIERNVRRVTISGRDLGECMLRSTDILWPLTTSTDQKIRLKSAFAERAREVVDFIATNAETPPESWGDDRALGSGLVAALGMKDTKGNIDDACTQAAKVARVVSNGMIWSDTSVEIPRDTLDGFLQTVARMHEDAVQQSLYGLPASPRVKCKECEYFAACTSDIVPLDGGDSDE